MTSPARINQAMRLLSNLLENTPNIVAIGRIQNPHGETELEVVLLEGTTLESGRIPRRILHIPITIRYLTRSPDYPTNDTGGGQPR